MCVSTCECLLSEDTLQNRKRQWRGVDARSDLTAGNMHEVKGRPPPPPKKKAALLAFSWPPFTSCKSIFNVFGFMCHLPLHLLEKELGGEHTERICQPLRSAKCSLPLLESITLTQQKERYLILGFGF